MTMNINNMPLTLTKAYTKAKQLLMSSTSGYAIAKRTGLNHSTIYRLKNGQRSMSSLTLRACLSLANYPNMKTFDYRDFQSKIFEALSYASSTIGISALSRQLDVGRTTLERLKSNQCHLNQVNIKNANKILRYWLQLRQKGIIKETPHQKLYEVKENN